MIQQNEHPAHASWRFTHLPRLIGSQVPTVCLLVASVVCVIWMWVKMEDLGDHRCQSSLVLTIQLLGYLILTHTLMNWFKLVQGFFCCWNHGWKTPKHGFLGNLPCSFGTLSLCFIAWKNAHWLYNIQSTVSVWQNESNTHHLRYSFPTQNPFWMFLKSQNGFDRP